MKEEIKKVTVMFETLNPGYTLVPSPPRNLNRQVGKWKSNNRVRTAADNFKGECLRELVKYPDSPDGTAIEKFRLFLKNHSVQPKPGLAAPGLSDHGHMHAVDFVVMHGKKKIADTDLNTTKVQWDDAGWTEKLREAVKKSNSAFKPEPLKKPYEPWHYVLSH